MNNKLPALIVEDLPEIQAWLAHLLERTFPGIDIKTASSLQSARKQLASSQGFRLALVDLGLPDGSGLELIREMHALQPSTPVIVTTVHDDDENLFGALAAGARGYLLKEQDDTQLLQYLSQFEHGHPALSPRIARRMLLHFQQQPPPVVTTTPAAVLSPRETEVLAAIGRGLRVTEVATRLGLADSTVTSYIKSIYVKLNISSRAQAALEAARRGLT